MMLVYANIRNLLIFELIMLKTRSDNSYPFLLPLSVYKSIQALFSFLSAKNKTD